MSWIGVIGWEVYEWLAVMFDPNTTIETGTWDLAIDLWIGALAICLINDEFKREPQKNEIK